MKKIIFLSFFIALFAMKMHAQVKISDVGVTTETPAAGALLELETTNKGFLMPRVALSATNSVVPFNSDASITNDATGMAKLAGMTVYNTANTTGTGRVTPGYYYNNGTKWVKLDEYSRLRWFYMPSIDIPVSYTNDSDRSKTVYLYEEYLRQFKVTAANSAAGLPASNIVTSDATYADVFSAIPGEVTAVAATDIIYFIVDYDTNLFENVNVSPTGVLTYRIIAGAVATDQSHMNIVFVRK